MDDLRFRIESEAYFRWRAEAVAAAERYEEKKLRRYREAEEGGVVSCHCGRQIRREEDPEGFERALHQLGTDGFWWCPACREEYRRWEEQHDREYAAFAEELIQQITASGGVKCPRCGHVLGPDNEEAWRDLLAEIRGEARFFKCPQCHAVGQVNAGGRVELWDMEELAAERAGLHELGQVLWIA